MWCGLSSSVYDVFLIWYEMIHIWDVRKYVLTSITWVYVDMSWENLNVDAEHSRWCGEDPEPGAHGDWSTFSQFTPWTVFYPISPLWWQIFPWNLTQPWSYHWEWAIFTNSNWKKLKRIDQFNWLFLKFAWIFLKFNWSFLKLNWLFLKSNWLSIPWALSLLRQLRQVIWWQGKIFLWCKVYSWCIKYILCTMMYHFVHICTYLYNVHIWCNINLWLQTNHQLINTCLFELELGWKISVSSAKSMENKCRSWIASFFDPRKYLRIQHITYSSYQ